MAKNNFHRMDDENFNERHNEHIQRVGQQVDGSVSFIQMVGRVIEVYLPRVFDVFLLMGGGKLREESHNRDEENNNIPPSDGGSGNFRGASGPSSPAQ